MYDIRQFKPTLYVLVMMGLTGFAIASESAGLWVVSVAVVLVNAWLVYSKRFAPMPRWLSNAVTVLSLAYVAQEMYQTRQTPILLIGQFLVLLQLVKLFEQRANRDYGQLLVLSLLLMVAASINTSRLVFGILLLLYLVVSLYGCLLFHLKVETDTAKRAQTLPEEKLHAATLRQDQRYLGRSMRRLTMLVTAVAVMTAVGIFLFFPRGSGTGMFGPIQTRQSEAMQAFSEKVNFQQVARITQSQEVVAWVKLWKDDKPVENGTLLLRGATLDQYVAGSPANGGGAWRNNGSRGHEVELDKDHADTRLIAPVEGTQWRQQVMLQPTGTRVLFALAGVETFRPKGDVSLLYNRHDQTIQSLDDLRRPLEYEVVSSNALAGESVEFRGAPPGPWRGRPGGRAGPGGAAENSDAGGARGWDRVSAAVKEYATASARAAARAARAEATSPIGPPAPAAASSAGNEAGPQTGGEPPGAPSVEARPAGTGGPPGSAAGTAPRDGRRGYRPRVVSPKVEEFARRPEVSGPLAAARDKSLRVDGRDEEIARNIEKYLRTQFTYTLDLTDAKSLMDGRDPIEVFLYDLKRGHCEYFAGAMTLMCQSLGMQARMVVGFHSDEYSGSGNMYIVRQSHAHAWVEVLTKEHGWQTFDPTSGQVAADKKSTSAWAAVKHFFNYLEYKWANAVVAYDSDRRESLIASVDKQMTNTAIRTTEAMGKARSSWMKFRDWLNDLDSAGFWMVSTKILAGLIALMVGGAMVAVLRYVWERRRMRRRATKIGLGALPEAERLRLAKQLGFYEELMRALERRRITRAPQQTPQEFSASLSFLPSEAYEAVRRLTRIFYRIRFGAGRLQTAQQRRLSQVVAKLSDVLGREGG